MRVDALAAAQQAPVLEVVDALEQPHRPGRLEQVEGEGAPAEGGGESEGEGPLGERGRARTRLRSRRGSHQRMCSSPSRFASRRQALRNCAGTVRRKKAWKLSPKRAVAGSSGVPTRTWWPRTCSVAKCS